MRGAVPALRADAAFQGFHAGAQPAHTGPASCARPPGLPRQEREAAGPGDIRRSWVMQTGCGRRSANANEKHVVSTSPWLAGRPARASRPRETLWEGAQVGQVLGDRPYEGWRVQLGAGLHGAQESGEQLGPSPYQVLLQKKRQTGERGKGGEGRKDVRGCSQASERQASLTREDPESRSAPTGANSQETETLLSGLSNNEGFPGK